MKLILKLTAATLIAGFAAPLFADTMMDPATMTCKDLMAMDSKGMMDAGAAMKEAMKDDAKMSAMSADDVTKAAEAACTAHPDGTVMDAVHM